MTSLRDLPELVQDSELEVTVEDAFTVYTKPLECRDNSSPQRWATTRTIGRGGDGTVFLQQKIEGPGETKTLAVKQMSLNADLASEDHDSKRYVRELEALAKFAQGKYSRSFVRTYGWYQDRGWLYICMEYCQHLDLGKYLRAHGTLSEEHVKVIALQVLHGLLQMHTNRFAHRDLKPANILIHRKPPENDAWWVVLGDLGLSRRSGASSGTTTIRGTPSFMAPETIGKPFLGDPKNADPFSADMWCLGETIARALTGQGTFSDNDHLFDYQERRVGFPDDALRLSLASADALNFVRSLMKVEPKERPTAAQALHHPWLRTNHTPNTAATRRVPNSVTESRAIIQNFGCKIDGLHSRELSTPDQTTHSAQWTRTIPIRSDDRKSPSALQSVAGTPTAKKLAGQSTPVTGLDLTGSEGVNDSGQGGGGGRSRQDHSKSKNSAKRSTFGGYILGQTLGEGQFSKVKMGWKQDSIVEVAIKLTRRETPGGNLKRLQKIYREIQILRQLDHSNIVRLHEFVETDRHIGIILEYASGGELFDYILHHRYLKDGSARKLFSQLISGVDYLHKKGIVHRDLQLKKLLLDRNRNIIITGFRSANTFNPNDKLEEEIEYRLSDKDFIRSLGLMGTDASQRGDLMQTSCGSPCYAAPELVIGDYLYTSRKVDVWSCGVILYAMLAGYLPFDDDPANPKGDNINLLYKYIVSTPLTFPVYVSPHARDLLKRILVPNPRKRADLLEVARHSWLAGYGNQDFPFAQTYSSNAPVD